MTDFKPIGLKQIRKQTFGECPGNRSFLDFSLFPRFYSAVLWKGKSLHQWCPPSAHTLFTWYSVYLFNRHKEKNKESKNDRWLIGDILQKGDLISLAPSTGLICVTSRENRISGNRPNFSILHPNGKLISSIKWNSAQIICLFWASDREIINVITDNGKLLQVRKGKNIKKGNCIFPIFTQCILVWYKLSADETIDNM